jgi:16S rRNA G966 N2-methylase RsmD
MEKLIIFLRRIFRHGLLGTVKLIPINIRYAWRALKPAEIAARRRERAFDRELGIDTAGNVPGGAVESESNTVTEITFYQPVSQQMFEQMIEWLPTDISSFCFIDIGSGKGRALVLAARRAFAEVIGIELSRRLHRTAEKNVARVQASLRTTVRTLNVDAREFVFPPRPTVVFLNNPFGEEVLRQVVENVEQTHHNSGAEVFLIYGWPIHEKVLQERRVWQECARGRHWTAFRFVRNEEH